MLSLTKSASSAALAALVATVAIGSTTATAGSWKSSSDAHLINKMIHGLSSHHRGWKKKHFSHKRGYKVYGRYNRFKRYDGYRYNDYDHYRTKDFAYHYGHKRKHWQIRSYGGGRVDLEVFFHVGSAQLTHRAHRVLDSLGEALSYGRLKHSYFKIGGHTDAAGSRYANKHLSQARAHAVKRYLVRYHGINPHRLVSVGYGEDRLAYPHRPLSKQNRRVEVSVISRATARRLLRHTNNYASH